MDKLHFKTVMLKAALLIAAGVGLGAAVLLGFPLHYLLLYLVFAPVPIVRYLWLDHHRNKLRLRLVKRARLDALYGPN